MRNVDEGPDAVGDAKFDALPERVQEALGELAGAAKEGLLALSVGVGLGVLLEIMEAEVDEVVGLKGKHNPDRQPVRHGHEGDEVTLGGRRVPVGRPRARVADGSGEVELVTYRRSGGRSVRMRAVRSGRRAAASRDRGGRSRCRDRGRRAARRSRSRSAMSPVRVRSASAGSPGRARSWLRARGA